METQRDLDARVKREPCGGLNEDGGAGVAGEAPNPQSAIRNPQSEDRPWRLAELENLHRRTIRLLTLQRPVAEAVLAIELSQGHIDNVSLERIVCDRETYARVCRNARAILGRGRRPIAPIRPRRGPLRRLLGLAGILTEEERNFRRRCGTYVAELMSLRARYRQCEVRPRGDAPMMARVGRADPLSDDALPAGCAEGPGTAAESPKPDDPPLLKLGPGGDYTRIIRAADLDAADQTADGYKADLQA